MTVFNWPALPWKDIGPGDWYCPGVSPHPARVMNGAIELPWVTQALGPYRVAEYTCSCVAVVYELISCGGAYQIHRTIQRDPPHDAWAGGWRREEAYQVWWMVLTGRAR